MHLSRVVVNCSDLNQLSFAGSTKLQLRMLAILYLKLKVFVIETGQVIFLIDNFFYHIIGTDVYVLFNNTCSVRIDRRIDS